LAENEDRSDLEFRVYMVEVPISDLVDGGLRRAIVVARDEDGARNAARAVLAGAQVYCDTQDKGRLKRAGKITDHRRHGVVEHVTKIGTSDNGPRRVLAIETVLAEADKEICS